jgi:hypothetical protein
MCVRSEGSSICVLEVRGSSICVLELLISPQFLLSFDWVLCGIFFFSNLSYVTFQGK